MEAGVQEQFKTVDKQSVVLEGKREQHDQKIGNKKQERKVGVKGNSEWSPTGSFGTAVRLFHKCSRKWEEGLRQKSFLLLLSHSRKGETKTDLKDC